MSLGIEHLKNDLRVTRKEAVTTSNLLADIRDLLDERLPSPDLGDRPLSGEGAGEPITVHDDEPARRVTVEPPVGSQVTDSSRDVWQRFEAGWTCWNRHVSKWGLGTSIDLRWGDLLNFAPLRPTTDADRERVGLPADTAPGVGVTDSDEALAAAMWHAEYSEREWPGGDDGWVSQRYMRHARAAREHIKGHPQSGSWQDIAELREAERDKWEAAAVAARTQQRAAFAERDEWQAKFDQTDSLLARTRDERDEALARCERLSVLAEKGERYEALRADVERMSRKRGPVIADYVASERASAILARDDERTPQADPDTVALRREDAEMLLDHWTCGDVDDEHDMEGAMVSRVRAALGRGDEA